MSLALAWDSSPGFEAGLKAFRAGDFDSAHELLANVLEAEPGQVEARHVLALTQRGLGLAKEASVNLAEVLREQPSNPEAWSNYGAVLRECGRLDNALEALETSTRLDPANALSWNNLGTVLLDLGRAHEALKCFERALAHKSDYADALVNLSRVLFEMGRLGEAKRSARSAIALAPRCAEAHNRLGFLQAAVGDLDGCLASLRRASECEPLNDRVASNLMLRSLADDRLTAADLRGMAEAWGSRYARTSSLGVATRGQVRRVGLVSGDFRNHPVGFFIARLVESLALEVEVFCYANQTKCDTLTERVKAASAGWRDILRVPAKQVAGWVAEDGIDVLVDLAGHTGDNRLDVFALRPAPVQATYLGYSGTTGLPQMDALVADHVLIPEGWDDAYTERVVRLPGSFLCFEPPEHAPEVSAPSGPPVFGVFNNPAKFSETSYRLWARVLEAVPGSEIVFKYHFSHDPLAQRHVRSRMEDFGIDGGRIRFAGYLDHRAHLDFLGRVHAALDTFPYSGATTTLDCLWSGAPVVTLAGDRYSSRMSASLLNAVGRPDLVAESEGAYVAIAASLAAPSDSCANERRALREGLLDSTVCDADGFARSWLEAVKSLL